MTKTYGSLDVAKFVLSLVIVFLHINPLGEQYGYLAYPLVRIAVPLFFMISAFLLFTKIEKARTKSQEREFFVGVCQKKLDFICGLVCDFITADFWCTGIILKRASSLV